MDFLFSSLSSQDNPQNILTLAKQYFLLLLCYFLRCCKKNAICFCAHETFMGHKILQLITVCAQAPDLLSTILGMSKLPNKIMLATVKYVEQLVMRTLSISINPLRQVYIHFFLPILFVNLVKLSLLIRSTKLSIIISKFLVTLA